MPTSPLPSCRVAVAVLNWNGAAHLRRFLPSVVAHNVPADRVVVIDNGSDDGSVDLLRNEFPDVEVVELSENHGFAGGYNEGLKALSARLNAEWVLLLNSDVEVTPQWVDGMVNSAEAQGWSAVQPKIRAVDRRAEFEYAGAAGGYMDRFGFMFCAGRIFDAFEQDTGQYDSDRPVFWAQELHCWFETLFGLKPKVWMLISSPTWKRLICAGGCATGGMLWAWHRPSTCTIWGVERWPIRVRGRPN